MVLLKVSGLHTKVKKRKVRKIKTVQQERYKFFDEKCYIHQNELKQYGSS